MLVITLVLLTICQDLPGQNPSGLRGKVTDWYSHKPRANAYILLHRSGAPDVHVRTDDNGKYSIALPLGIYDAFISADYYTPTCRKVQIEPDGMMIFDATLQFNELGMEIN